MTRQPTQRRDRVGDDDSGKRQRCRTADQCRSRTLRGGLHEKVVTVEARAAQGHEQLAAAQRARVGGDARKLPIRPDQVAMYHLRERDEIHQHTFLMNPTTICLSSIGTTWLPVS